jgi:hypothetical protein
MMVITVAKKGIGRFSGASTPRFNGIKEKAIAEARPVRIPHKG